MKLICCIVIVIVCWTLKTKYRLLLCIIVMFCSSAWGTYQIYILKETIFYSNIKLIFCHYLNSIQQHQLIAQFMLSSKSSVLLCWFLTISVIVIYLYLFKKK